MYQPSVQDSVNQTPLEVAARRNWVEICCFMAQQVLNSVVLEILKLETVAVEDDFMKTSYIALIFQGMLLSAGRCGKK